jgi:predicted  nucleic acid-binding Zn-ribbon protein
MTAAVNEDFVRRPELDQALEGIRRELSGLAKAQAETRDEMNEKLDKILDAKVQEARQMGELKTQVENLQGDITQRGTELAEIRKRQDAPRDGVVRFVVDVLKLTVAAGIGWAARKGH